MSDNSPTIKLADLIDTTRTEEGVWVQYQNTGFHVRVTYYGKLQMQQMYENAKTTHLNMRSLHMDEELDKEKFRKLYACRVIREWKGLTVGVLRKLVVIRLDASLDDATEIPCTDENKEMLILNSLEFDQWLGSITQQVDTFNEKKLDEELKN